MAKNHTNHSGRCYGSVAHRPELIKLVRVDDQRSESHKMALGHPLEEPLKIYPVSDLVNSPKTDDARCIEPVRIDRDFFERQWWCGG